MEYTASVVYMDEGAKNSAFAQRAEVKLSASDLPHAANGLRSFLRTDVYFSKHYWVSTNSLAVCVQLGLLCAVNRFLPK